jgi:hypothetical protein
VGLHLTVSNTQVLKLRFLFNTDCKQRHA